MTTAPERTPRTEAPTAPAAFDSVNPATGEIVGTFAIRTAHEVAATVTRAREAAGWWSGLSYRERRTHMKAIAAELMAGFEELAELVHRENGKPIVDAKLEIASAVDMLDWASANAKRVLGLRRKRSTPFLINHTAYVEYQPLGVVGVIAPWNFPVFTAFGPTASSLAAGNTVVIKPSEYTPATVQWIADAIARAVPEHPIVQIVTGDGSTGAALCRSGVDKVSFTGSTATGRRIMAACAETLTPVVLELGGKDALIVAADADIDRAATATVWGGLQNAGQACVSIERVYVVDSVYDAFVAKVVEKARAVRAGNDDSALIGPITMPSQVGVIKRHVDDALARGAKPVVGGADSLRGGPWVDPVVLTDVPEDALAITEETFGPTLPIQRVRDVEEAIALTNRSRYGLGSTVFAKKGALDMARRIRTGGTSINA